MRRPHVYERTAPRLHRGAYHEQADQASMARILAAQLRTMLDKAEQAGCSSIAPLLELARIEAEKVAMG
jgi:hypothetical protein